MRLSLVAVRHLSSAVIVLSASAGLAVASANPVNSQPAGFEYLGRIEKSSWKGEITPIYTKDFALSNKILSGFIKLSDQGGSDKLRTYKVFVDCERPRTQVFSYPWNFDGSEKNWGKLLRARYCPGGDMSVVTAAKNFSPAQNSISSSVPVHRKKVEPSSNSIPIGATAAKDDIHEKCLEARDYQGCIDSFSGRRSSANSSDYEERMLELQRQALYEQRRNTMIENQRESARIDRERRQQRGDAFKKAMDGIADAFKPKLSCTSSSLGSSVYTDCY